MAEELLINNVVVVSQRNRDMHISGQGLLLYNRILVS